MFDLIPDSLLTLLLRKLPRLPVDPNPQAAWSVTSTREAFNSLLSLAPTEAIPPALMASLRGYLNQASDGQLAWLAEQMLVATMALDEAMKVDKDKAPAPPGNHLVQG